MTQGRGQTPERLSQAVTELIALRGWAQVQGRARLDAAWKAAAGASIAAGTKVLGIRRSVLQVAVGNSPLLSELATWHKPSLLAALARECPELKVRDLKFVLKGNLPAA
jgi:predicted nucleic acid-binding Zn ribbon protein